MRTLSVVPLRPTRLLRPRRLVALVALLRLLVLLGPLGILSSTAHAGSDVGLVVGGESWMQPQLTAQIEGWLSQHGHGVVKLPPDALDAIKQCFASRAPPGARGVVDKLPRPASVIYAGIEARNATS